MLNVFLLIFSFNIHAGIDDLNLTSAVDFLAPIHLNDSSDNKSKIRSAEVMLYGPIDHLFSGKLNIAGHEEDGEFSFELHEGYVQSNVLIPRSEIKLGKFLLDIGRLNNIHQHDWLFTTAPKVHREFLNPGSDTIEAESAADTGVEYSLLVPGNHFFNVKVGVTNGYCFGHCHNDSSRPSYPLHYIRTTGFIPINSQTGWLMGASYLARIEGSSTQTRLYGLDLTYKNRQNSVLKWLSQSEVYYQWQKNPVDVSYKTGFYSYLQFGQSKQISYGLRVDGYSHLNQKFESNGESRENFDYALSPSITYTASEFSKIKLTYLHEVDTQQGIEDISNKQILLQFVYFLGAHPTHDF